MSQYMPKQCCATGSLHTGTPTGRLERLHGLNCYIADPPSSKPKGVVVIIPDAFGIALPNNCILADEYAKKGNFLVILPDFMDGRVVPAHLLVSFKAFGATGFLAQIMKLYHAVIALRHMLPFLYFCRSSVCGPRVYDFFKALRAHEAANLPVGAAGFCWGGYWVFQLARDVVKTDDGKRLMDAGFTAHPSQLNVPSDIEKAVVPVSVAAAEIDMVLSKDQAFQVRDILAAKSAKMKDSGVEHEFEMYEGAHHGFAVRCDEEDKEEAAQGKKAEEQAVRWFERWFSSAAQ
ncbi:hypothetical protein LTR66_004238 [Elasticomyces elasticus]|nr:hypothetical protein LTR66_004238 [Elasticomyces elasticus]